MAAELALLVGVPAVVAVGAAASGGTPATAPPPKNVTSTGAVTLQTPSRNQPVSTPLYTRFLRVGQSDIRTTKTATDKITDGAQRVTTNYSTPVDPALQQKLDEINSYGEAAYNNLDDGAKRAGAKALSDQLKLDPPLKGDESWDDIAKVAGGAAGAAALGWIPGGQIIGPMVGAYLGVKLEELIGKNVDDIKAWFKTRWTDIEGWVKGAANDVEDAVSDTIDYFGGWF